MNGRDLGDDKTRAALSPAFDIGDVGFADDAAVIGQSGTHRRYDKPVGQFESTNFNRFQQMLPKCT